MVSLKVMFVLVSLMVCVLHTYIHICMTRLRCYIYTYVACVLTIHCPFSSTSQVFRRICAVAHRILSFRTYSTRCRRSESLSHSTLVNKQQNYIAVIRNVIIVNFMTGRYHNKKKNDGGSTRRVFGTVRRSYDTESTGQFLLPS